jgi:8-oxo-dGTP pyrophosphatase MutT (NUDIX family)
MFGYLAIEESASQMQISLSTLPKKTRDRTQFAALPFRIGTTGRFEIMLLTSRETGRWVIPKGWPIKGLKPREVAAREACEEAGLVGSITSKRPIGIYHYEKQFAEGGLLCEVRVFLFRVDQQLDDWPEKGQRETRWLDLAEAAALVNEGGLAEIIRFASHQPQRLKHRVGDRLLRALLPSGIHQVQR